MRALYRTQYLIPTITLKKRQNTLHGPLIYRAHPRPAKATPSATRKRGKLLPPMLGGEVADEVALGDIEVSVCERAVGLGGVSDVACTTLRPTAAMTRLLILLTSAMVRTVCTRYWRRRAQ